jgi:hypothetical protein
MSFQLVVRSSIQRHFFSSIKIGWEKIVTDILEVKSSTDPENTRRHFSDNKIQPRKYEKILPEL